MDGNPVNLQPQPNFNMATTRVMNLKKPEQFITWYRTIMMLSINVQWYPEYGQDGSALDRVLPSGQFYY